MFIASVCPSVRPSACLKPKFGRLKTKFDDDAGSAKRSATPLTPEKLRVRSVAPWIVDFRGFLISMDGFFGGCSIASKFPMDDQNPW